MLPRNHLRNFLFVSLMVLGIGVPRASAWQLGSREAKEWIERLEAPTRIAGLKVDEIISRLSLKPGVVVADIGAGTGVFSRPLAKAVAPNGKVYAVDVDPGLLDYINQRAKQENLSNIQTVLGKFDDPAIPNYSVDLAFFHDVLHHIEHREIYLKALAAYLKPNSRIALIEMEESDPNTPHKSQPEMLLGRKQVDAWMNDIGFRPAQEFDVFKGTKWFVIYERTAQSSKEHEGMDMMDDMMHH